MKKLLLWVAAWLAPLYLPVAAHAVTAAPESPAPVAGSRLVNVPPGELSNYTVSADTVFGAGTYVIQGDLWVPAGTTLTLSAGTILKFRGYWNSLVVDGGSLVANGTAGSPVILTAAGDAVGAPVEGAAAAGPNQWGGVVVNHGGGAEGQVTLRHTHLRYGGGETYAMLQGVGTSPTLTDCRIEFSGEDAVHFRHYSDGAGNIYGCNPQFLRTTFADNAGDAIDIFHSSPTGRSRPVMTQCTFARNGALGWMGDQAFIDFDGACTLIPGAETLNGLRLAGSTRVDGTWSYPGPGFAYILAGDYGVHDGATLTLEPGVVVKGNSYWHSLIVTNASLHAVGSASRPIVFTSLADDTAGGDTQTNGNASEPSVNEWGGILLRWDPDTVQAPAATLTHVHLRHGGGETLALLEFYGSSPQLTDCRLEFSGEDGAFGRYHVAEDVVHGCAPLFWRTRVAGNAGEGIEMSHEPGPGVSVPVIHGCTFQNNGAAMAFASQVFPDFDGANVLVNAVDRTNGMRVAGATQQDGAWERPGANFPWLLADDYVVRAGATLSVEPGVVVKATSYWHSLYIEGSRLEVDGTAQMPVVFTSYPDDSAGGDAQGDGNQAATVNQWGGIIVTRSGENGQFGSTLRMHHTELRYGGGETNALLEVHGSDAELAYVTAAHSAGHGVHIAAWDARGSVHASSATVTQSTFRDNDVTGLSLHHGVFADGSAFQPEVTHCHFARNHEAMAIGTNTFPVFNGTLTQTIEPETNRAGLAIAGQATVSGAWDYPGPNVPYLLDGDYVVAPGVMLTIESGTVVKGTNYWHSLVIDGGKLHALGTPGQPIIFTSAQDDRFCGDTNGNDDGNVPEGGDWGGVVLRYHVDSNRRAEGHFSYVQAHYGGGETRGNVEVMGADATLTDGLFTASAEAGLYVGDVEGRTGAATVRYSGFTQNASGLVVTGDAVALMETNRFAGNTWGVRADGSQCLDARGSWWGHANGPHDPSESHDCVAALGEVHVNLNEAGDRVTNKVRYAPWLGQEPVVAPWAEVVAPSLTWTVTEGQNAAPQVLSIRNAGGGTLEYSIGYSMRWLQAIPHTGSSQGEWDQLSLHAQTEAMTAAGSPYSATITITGNAANLPMSFPVSVEVLPSTGDLWAGATDLGGGWYWVSWYGSFARGIASWVFHAEHGWQWVDALRSPYDILIFDLQIGWLWTTVDMYPTLYSWNLTPAGWYWYEKGRKAPRRFVHLATSAWLEVPAP